MKNIKVRLYNKEKDEYVYKKLEEMAKESGFEYHGVYLGVRDKNDDEIFTGDILYKPGQKVMTGGKFHRPVKTYNEQFKEFKLEKDRRYKTIRSNIGDSSGNEKGWLLVGNSYKGKGFLK